MFAAGYTAGISQNDPVVVAFWNVENLFDTIDDPVTHDNDFTPRGKNRWTTDRYDKKIERLSQVLYAIGSPESKNGAALAGLCEVENAAVLEDLVNSRLLKKRKYRYVILDGPDERGIDVALLYDPQQYEPERITGLNVELPDTTDRTRHILLVDGWLNNRKLAVLVNHWPSRRGGERSSRPFRFAAANRLRSVCDSLLEQDSTRSILVMGDFNDDPVSPSVRNILGAVGDPLQAGHSSLFNPMSALHSQGKGSLAWNDAWNLFDQIMLSKNLLDGKAWTLQKADVYNKPSLRTGSGNYRGYPFRTFSGGVYSGGYSDHFPVYVVLSQKSD